MSKEEITLKGKLVQLGIVGVDSGQIVVCDPCYIKSEWKDTQYNGNRIYKDKDTGIEYEYPTHFENFEKKFEVAHFKFIELNSKNKKELGEKLTTKLFKERKGKTINDLVAEGLFEKVKKEPSKEFSYNGCCEATVEDKNGGGQLVYTMGHEGAGVASRTRHGDGTYNVFAQLDETGRTKRLIIDFGNEEDEDCITEENVSDV